MLTQHHTGETLKLVNSDHSKENFKQSDQTDLATAYVSG
jgi:hypothetical protein